MLDVVLLSIAIPARAWYLLMALVTGLGLRVLAHRSESTWLRIDDAGLQLARMDIAWSNISHIERRRPPFTWSDRLVFQRPYEYPKWLSFQQVRKLSPSRYEADWRNGRIGEDIGRWAPHLLDRQSARV